MFPHFGFLRETIPPLSSSLSSTLTIDFLIRQLTYVWNYYCNIIVCSIRFIVVESVLCSLENNVLLVLFLSLLLLCWSLIIF